MYFYHPHISERIGNKLSSNSTDTQKLQAGPPKPFHTQINQNKKQKRITVTVNRGGDSGDISAKHPSGKTPLQSTNNLQTRPTITPTISKKLRQPSIRPVSLNPWSL